MDSKEIDRSRHQSGLIPGTISPQEKRPRQASLPAVHAGRIVLVPLDPWQMASINRPACSVVRPYRVRESDRWRALQGCVASSDNSRAGDLTLLCRALGSVDAATLPASSSIVPLGASFLAGTCALGAIWLPKPLCEACADDREGLYSEHALARKIMSTLCCRKTANSH